jgi:phosphatidate cytidylyltransferase
MNPLSWLDVDRAAFTLDLDLGPLQFSTTGRAVFFFYVTMGLLAVGGLAVAVSGKA